MANGAKFSLKILIDEKRNKVVLAEAEQDFVDVLLSLLTLPMGKIASLLENHKTVLGCYKNLNKSVADTDTHHFETEACKSMLMYPKSSKDIHRRRLKLNMGYTHPTEFFVCPSFCLSNSCGSRAYSNFKTSRCSSGALMVMNARIHVPEEEQVGETIGDVADGVFVNCRSSFIITDDLKVTSNSIGVLMNVLKDLGYNGYSDLQETLIDVGFEEVVALLGCLFTSEAPLTCTFLRKTCMTSKMLHEISMSVFCVLRKMCVDINDLEEYEISISKAELISILRASLISSSALTNGLSNLLIKKPKKETSKSTQEIFPLEDLPFLKIVSYGL